MYVEEYRKLILKKQEEAAIEERRVTEDEIDEEMTDDPFVG